jgi:hypothetical protein
MYLMKLSLQVYTQILSITNKLSTAVEASFRPGSSDRYSVHPKVVRLKPGCTSEVEIKLKILKFANLEKAVEYGQKDTFHVKTQYFDQQFSATFYLSPQVLGTTSKGSSKHNTVKEDNLGEYDEVPRGMGTSYPRCGDFKQRTTVELGAGRDQNGDDRKVFYRYYTTVCNLTEIVLMRVFISLRSTSGNCAIDCSMSCFPL